jgi:Ca2+-binding EF-hand superfamily protein
MSLAPFKQSMKRRVRPELSEEQRQEIKEAFELFDINKDGAIDFHELKYIFPYHYPAPLYLHPENSLIEWLCEHWDSMRRNQRY